MPSTRKKLATTMRILTKTHRLSSLIKANAISLFSLLAHDRPHQDLRNETWFLVDLQKRRLRLVSDPIVTLPTAGGSLPRLIITEKLRTVTLTLDGLGKHS